MLRNFINKKSSNEIDSLFHDHNYLWAGVVGGETLDHLRVVKTFHQLNFLACCCLVCRGPGSVELPCTHLARLFMGQAEYLSKLPTGRL